MRRLVDNTFSRQEDTTQGIRIRQWPIKVGRKNEEVRLHVWDFGGQEIMHAKHQFFLTDRSLYLLVLDGRGGQQEAEADYWLRLIASFAPESPVWVVLNKIQKDHFTLTVRELLEGVELAPIFAATARTASRRRDEKRPHYGLYADSLYDLIHRRGRTAEGLLQLSPR